MAGGRDMRALLVAPAQKWQVPRRSAKRPDAAVRQPCGAPDPAYRPSILCRLKTAEIAEFLHPFALDFAAVDIAFGIDADEMEVVEFAKLVADAAV